MWTAKASHKPQVDPHTLGDQRPSGQVAGDDRLWHGGE